MHLHTLSARGLTLLFVVLLSASLTAQSKLLHPEDTTFIRAAPPAFKVVLETTKGNVVLDVKREWSPNGVDRFYNLVRNGYYDDIAVFRVRAGVWAQFGIAGSPAVAQAWRIRNLPDDPRMFSNTRGTVAYAFKDPNGRTTQMFINLRDNSATHGGEPFVPFAKVVEGMEVADALYSGYGESSGGGIRAGKQDSAFAGGNVYFRQRWPLLDYIKRALIIKD